MNIIYKGKVKTIYESDNSYEVLIDHEDKICAGNGKKQDIIVGKGLVNSQISAILFEQLNDVGVKTHYLKMAGVNLMRCHFVDMLPLEVVIRNFVAGSLAKETHLRKGIHLNYPLIDFYLKDDELGDPLLTEDRMRNMGYSDILIGLLRKRVLEINLVLTSIFDSIGLHLIDLKLEFGRTIRDATLVLADELSPDNMRLWSQETHESKDKDLYRKDQGGVFEAYSEVLNKLTVLVEERKAVVVESSTSSDPLPVDISEFDVPEPKMEEPSPESSLVSSE